MAVESSIGADDGWFVGEAKILRYEFLDQDDTTAWLLRWELRRRREDTPPVVLKTSASGIVGGVGFVLVNVLAVDTLSLTSTDDYHAVLWRTDAGNEQVLSYGPVVLREVIET